MSQYIEFFIKEKGNKAIPIGSYSRSSNIYQRFNDAIHIPYENVTTLTNRKLGEVIKEVKLHKEENDTLIKQYNHRIDLIGSWNNSAEEKSELISQCEETISNLEEDNTGLDSVIAFAYFLQDIIQEFDYTTRYGEDKDRQIALFVGIECGNNIPDSIFDTEK